MGRCYNCGDILTDENASREHIIPNGIGGWLKSKDLLCQQCNSNFGSDCDAELVSQLLFLTSHLKVKKDRGDIQPIKGGKTADNQEYTIINGSKPTMAKPVFKKTVEGNTTNYNIQARNEDEMRKILEGLKKKHPDLDVDEEMKKAKHKKEYLQKPIEYQNIIGGNLAFRSIAKSAINYYLVNSENKDVILHLLPFIKGDAKMDIVGYYNPKKLPYTEIDPEIIHMLHLVGDSANRTLYCYVNFFSTYSFVVLLSNQYNGQAFTHTYAYDVLLNQTVEKTPVVHLTPLELQSIIREKNPLKDAPIIAAKLERVLAIASKRHSSETINKIISETIQKIFAEEYAHEAVITEKMLSDFAKKIPEEFVRFKFCINDDF